MEAELRDLAFHETEIAELVKTIDNLSKKRLSSNENYHTLKLEINELNTIRDRYRSCVMTCNARYNLDDNNEKKSSKTLLEQYNALNTKCKKAISKGQIRLHEYSDEESSSNDLSAMSKTKLPDIAVPKFDGNLVDFLEFKSLFCSLIHNDPSIPRSSKLYFLKQALVGDAKEIIKDLPETEEAYEEAWKLVLETYSDIKSIIRKHLDNLFAIQRIESRIEIPKLLLSVQRILKGLKACGENVEEWSTVISYIVSERLDDRTYEDFENVVGAKDKFPSWETLREFLQTRSTATLRNSDPKRKSTPKGKEGKSQKSLVATTVLPENATNVVRTPIESKQRPCLCCGAVHLLIECAEFLAKPVNQRYELIKERRLCFNCFNTNHSTKECRKRPNCKQCNKAHHTLLHYNADQKSSNQPGQSNPRISWKTPSIAGEKSKTSSSLACVAASQPTVVLPSAIVKFKCNNVIGTARILLDSCAQSTLATESFVKKFNLPTVESKFTHNIVGIGNAKESCNRNVNLELLSRVNNFSIKINANVMSSPISYSLNRVPISQYSQRLSEFVLADPEFYKPNVSIPEVDILIGVEYYDRITTDEPRKWIDTVCLRATQFGWTVSSAIQDSFTAVCTNLNNSYCGLTINENDAMERIDNRLKAFWEMEEVPYTKPVSTEAERCVNHFNDTVTRTPNGRFMVRLPFKENPNEVTNNYRQALAYLKRNEKRLDEKTKIEYIKFMREYIDLGHMSPVCEFVPRYFIPHHAIRRETSTSTPLRVVFHASSKSPRGKSLNDILMVGPVIQPELFDALVRFRSYVVAWTGDISKMYRCVLVHPDDRRYQSILWRESPNDPVRVYELNTATYGTAPASFVVTKCLEVLARENKKKFPEAAELILRNFYMDDFLGGAKTVESAIKLRNEVHQILESGGFMLRKYRTNSEEVQKSIPVNLLEGDSLCLLGLSWCPTEDALLLRAGEKTNIKVNEVTKRMMLAKIARIFDPLGLASPVIIRGKIYFQRLWKIGTSWDEPIIDNLAYEFRNYLDDVADLSDLPIRRSYGEGRLINLVGFSDASEKAYCMSVYTRTLDKNGIITTTLIAAKTRVAPMKKLTIPQLELQAAAVLIELVERVRNDLMAEIDTVRLYSDSKIVLSWLSKPAKEWKTYVSNRVSKISVNYPREVWNYVPSKLNPADLGTRGLTTKQLRESVLWFNGPFFLLNPELPEEEIEFKEEANQFRAKPKVSHNLISVETVNKIESISSYTRLVRIYATVYRIFWNWKAKTFRRKIELSAEDIKKGEAGLQGIVQRNYYSKEIYRLKENRKMPRRSPLRAHAPFLDDNGAIRIRTRLYNAPIPFERKQPIVLPAKCHFTKLWVIHLHIKLLHASRSVISAHLSAGFHFTGGIQGVIKKVIRNCHVCIRYRAANSNQIMADLPESRVSPARPFSICGVDFSGAFTIKCTNHRSQKYLKSYACLFVCFVTRAVHIEAVSSLSSEDFLNCFHRFIARRGLPRHVRSDNGTNFVGADGHLNLSLSEANIQEFAANERIEWSFNLPGVPHRGGIWERAIGSAKKFIPMVTKDQPMTFEELMTLLARIEGILNSRPLCYKETGESEYEVLTPGHFLVGENLTILPEPDNSPNLTLSERYKANTTRIASFWKLWYDDYLNSLKSRSKWVEKQPNLVEGDVVILKNKLTKPSQWKIGKVTKTFPDRHGDVRTVEIFSNGESKQMAVQFLIPLPISQTSPVSVRAGDSID